MSVLAHLIAKITKSKQTGAKSGVSKSENPTSGSGSKENRLTSISTASLPELEIVSTTNSLSDSGKSQQLRG